MPFQKRSTDTMKKKENNNNITNTSFNTLGKNSNAASKGSGGAPQRFHTRTTTFEDIPKPSLKPPSTFHSFRGDLKSQDIFVEEIKKRCVDKTGNTSRGTNSSSGSTSGSSRTNSNKVRILFPGADKFEMTRMGVWNHDSICSPCLILQPKTNRQVAACLRGYVAGIDKCLSANRKHGAALAIPRLAIAGGRNSIHCMLEGAIVLDMSKMRSIKVDKSNNTCKVEGGAKIIDVDVTLAEHGLMSVLSTSQHGGVVGCILGGGNGYASRKYGLACDNVVSADIIQANGRIFHCDFTKHRDLFWSICGGGGGLGVIVSVTLKCHPLRNTALLTYRVSTTLDQRRLTIRHWANWMFGDVDNENIEKGNNDFVQPYDSQAPNDVYSQLLIPSDSPNIHFLATSIDTNAINQTNGYIEEFEAAQRKMKKKSGPFGIFFNNHNSSNHDSNKHYDLSGVGSVSSESSSTVSEKGLVTVGWSDVPHLNQLIKNKFGGTASMKRSNVQFRFVRYADQLQSYSNEYFTPGNIFSTIKYCETLSNRIIEILAQATLGDISPNNESKIVVMTMGGQVSGGHGGPTGSKGRVTGSTTIDDLGDHSAFYPRQSKYMIYIEGKWEANSGSKLDNEKMLVMKWVHWIVNQLHFCKGVASSTHPESTRDQLSRSGKKLPGYYNFDKISGIRLTFMKRKIDPKNIFSLASRVSWPKSSDPVLKSPRDLGKNGGSIPALAPASDDNQSVATELSKAENVKDGEIDPTECFNVVQSDDDNEIRGDFHKNDKIAVINKYFDGDNDGDNDGDELELVAANTTETNQSDENILETKSSDGENEDSHNLDGDLKMLLSLTDSDEALKDWTITPVALTKADFDSNDSF